MTDEQTSTSTSEQLAAMKYPLIQSNEEERRVLFERKLLSYHSSNSYILEPGGKKRNGFVYYLRIAIVLFLAGIGILSIILVLVRVNKEETSSSISATTLGDELPMGIPRCREEAPCFTPAKIRVPTGRPGFPSFWSYAHQGPLQVSYDSRAITINGERVFFLGGSLHPSRATKKTWSYALDEAVRNGLNLITIYVMWSAHQPVPTKDIDWGFPQSVECDAGDYASNSCDWTLATAIRSAADRGLFVHLRVGPYDCAEYNYGGIPEWLALHKPKMAMRRPNREWLDVMEGFVTQMIDYITDNRLWAHQGGNIVMAQIENELGGDIDQIGEHLLFVDGDGRFVDPDAVAEPPIGTVLRNASLQDYADWCGDLVDRLAPNVTWTMCNGLSANNTILTCNDVGGGTNFLENHGGNGRIQIDQPAIFTEFEGGFQTWGEEATNPNDYFWGRTARAMARDALRWFARGGTHLNYYMWWGGYNRGRAAGAGIANMYASDAALCPSGQRRQPKFGHFQALHQAITAMVPTLLAANTALGKGRPIPFMNDDGNWETGDDQRIFEYRADGKGLKHVIFVENDAQKEVVVQVPIGEDQTRTLSMSALSVILLSDGMMQFDSASIDPRKTAFERKFADGDNLPMLLDWSSWKETIGAASADPMTWTRAYPVEQTELNVDSRVYSDYAWYETSFSVGKSADKARLFIETQRASAYVVYIDDEYVGAADDHLHKEGPTTLTVDIGDIAEGEHKLRFLSESLGYNNLIGRWGGSTDAKTKGITGDVLLSVGDLSKNTSLVDGREWRSFPGLHGESISGNSVRRARLESDLEVVSGRPTAPTWSSALFDTPRYDPATQALFIKITSGRGHLWLNGRDLGRYWNITRGESQNYTQEYYFLPDDYFHTDGRLNDIVLFDGFGETNSESQSSAKLVMSWIAPSELPNFKDEVDYPLACI
jgi:hypothetical protein